MNDDLFGPLWISYFGDARPRQNVEMSPTAMTFSVDSKIMELCGATFRK